MTQGTLPSLAEAIRGYFPDLGGRAIAVSDVYLTPENLPTLPMCLCALDRAVANPATSFQRVVLDDMIIVQFWYPPERYKRPDNSETPFWSYYDYESLRERLLTLIISWKSPRGDKLRYASMTIAGNQYAVMITFRFSYTTPLCEVDLESPNPDGISGDGNSFQITVTGGLLPC